MKLLVTAVVMTAMLSASAQAQICTVNNHTRKMTNVRNSARGQDSAAVIGGLRNGAQVRIIGSGRDRQGNVWDNVSFARRASGGWVLGRQLQCARSKTAVLTHRLVAPPWPPARDPALAVKPALAPVAVPPQPLAPKPSPEPASVPATVLALAPAPITAPASTSGPDAAATIPKTGELTCELVGKCSGLRLGIRSDDHSCPNGLGVSDGTYRIAFNASDRTITLFRPDLEETMLAVSCKGGKCEAEDQGADKDTRWTHSLVLTNSNRQVDYTYRLVSDFGDGMSFAITHVYHGTCKR